MDPQDAEVGFWVKDRLYTFEPSTHKEGARRLYFVETPEYAKLQRCEGWASRYFGTYDQKGVTISKLGEGIKIRSSDVIVYRGGRVFYFYDLYPTQIPFQILNPIPEDQRSTVCENLSLFNGVDYDMSSLICTQFALSSRRWEDILDIMKRCKPLSKCDPCTNIGYKIAKSLIKIAALRIFADPEQSIMELPVNSLDAYATKDGNSRKIGKFGMGFFSMFYWLIGHPKRKMVIHSYSRDEDGKWCTFRVMIREIDGVLSFSLEIYPGSEITTPGFRVLIDAAEDPFTRENVEHFRQQLDKLKFASGAQIISEVSTTERKEVKDGGVIPVWWNIFEDLRGRVPVLNNKGHVSPNQIICYVCPSFILTEDYAIGVPLLVVLGSLFVPSISTKTIRLSEGSVVAYDNNSSYLPGSDMVTPNRLVILVGGIAVVSLETGRGGEYYVIHMPYNTRLPVSRDDIILTSEGASIFRDSIAKIFGDIERSTADVSTFQELLTRYKEFTPSTENRDVATRAMNEFFEANKRRLIPSKHKDIYNRVRVVQGPKFIVSQVYDPLEVERWLDANTNPQTNIWYGMKVLVVPGEFPRGVTNGGLINYLFVSENYKAPLGTGWIRSITSSYFETKLYPYDSSYGAKEYDKYNTINLYGVLHQLSGYHVQREDVSTQTAYNYLRAKPQKVTISQIIEDPDLVRYIFAVLAKFESLTTYFDFGQDTTTSNLLSQLVASYIFLKRASFVAVLGELMKKFSSFIGSQTYGSSKYSLKLMPYTSMSILPVYFTDRAIPQREKMEGFMADHMICAIRAIKEGPDTQLVIVADNNPLNLVRPHRNNNFGSQAWIQSSNIVEFTILITGAGVAFQHKTINTPVMGGFVAYILQDIRARRYDMKTLVDMYDTWGNNYYGSARHTRIFLIKAGQEARQWLDNIQNTSTIPTTTEYRPPDEVINLRLGKMIRALFESDIPGASNLPAFLREVSADQTEKSPLQIIEIAVNEGTVKPFIDATMTELVQNSIDAIREFNPVDKVIDIDLKKVPGGKLVLSITDMVGMSSDAFVYVGIPFLSTKTPSELVTGEMGSGFFNSYRESSSVLIKSSKDGVLRLSYDRPIRDDRERVVEIEKSMLIKREPKLSNRTDISITIPTTSLLDEITKIARVDYTAKNVLGLALVPGIRYNGVNVSIPKILVAKIGYFELYFTDPDTSLKHESYLLTKGVPFSPLAPYFKPYLVERVLDVIERNFIVNITHGGYTPVQTRTRINVAPEVAADFKKVAIYTVFITMVREIFQKRRYYAFNHLESKSNAFQLYFTEYNIDALLSGDTDESMFLLYTSFFGQPTIAALINRCITVMGSETYATKIKEVEAVLDRYVSPSQDINDIVRAIVIRWLEPKNTQNIPPPEEKGKVKYRIKGKWEWVDPDTVPDEPDPEVESFIRAWIQTYWRLARESDISGFKDRNYQNMTNYELAIALEGAGFSGKGIRKDLIDRLRKADEKSKVAPKVIVTYSIKEQSKNGWYSPMDGSITINTYNWDAKDRKQIIQVLKAKKLDDIETKLKNNKTWDKFFGYSFPAATLPHEMEHLRRHGSHEKGGHDSTHLALFPGDENKSRTFDQAANQVFQQILGRGFYDKFFKAI
jgi:hypothetical protein